MGGHGSKCDCNECIKTLPNSQAYIPATIDIITFSFKNGEHTLSKGQYYDLIKYNTSLTNAPPLIKFHAKFNGFINNLLQFDDVKQSIYKSQKFEDLKSIDYPLTISKEDISQYTIDEKNYQVSGGKKKMKYSKKFKHYKKSKKFKK